MDSKALSDAFGQWCHSRALAPHTLRSYQREGDRLRRWWSLPKTRRRLDQTTGSLLREALSSQDAAVLMGLGITQPLSTGSLLQSKRILSAFFFWLALRIPKALAVAMDLKRWKPVGSGFKVARAAASGASEGALHFLARAPGKTDTLRMLRDQWIRQLTFWSNASRGQLAALRMRDFRESRDMLQVRLPARNGGTAWTVLPHLCLDWWLAYCRSLPSAPDDTSPALRSLTQPTAGLSEASISRIVSSAGSPTEASGPRPTLRSLRRDFVALGYRSGLREGVLARHMRRVRIPADVLRSSLTPAEAVEMLAHQFVRETRKAADVRASGGGRPQ